MTLTHEEHARPDALRAAIRRGDVDRPDRRPRARPRPGQPRRAARRPTRSTSCASASRNPQPCPVLEVTDPGSAEPVHIAPGADLRTDLPALPRLPRRRAGRRGRATCTGHWRDDLVAFLLGCSFTFERALLAAGLPVRHLEQGVNVPMYRTSIACRPAGRFAGRWSSRCARCAPTRRSARPRSPRASSARTARRSTSATRPRSASRTSTGPTTATRSRSATARCRCSGRAA